LLTVPLGRAEELIVNCDTGVAAITIELAADWVCTGLLLSDTETVKLEVPPLVGVPEVAPVADAKLSPAGRLPDETDHLYGLVPPVALKVPLYALLTVPLGKATDGMSRAAGVTCRAKVVWALIARDDASLTVMLTE
jgi:hypothetical protein